MVMTPPSDSSVPGSPGLQPSIPVIQGVPRAEFYPRPNSHPFQNRTLLFSGADMQIKVGRSVARSKPSPSNGIFDCKVLSRNHALLWYENGKFYLQDTKSSNGTFVNNQRLSKGSEESQPREVCSGDILQFGVDVVENSRKVTHGCIIATIKLYLPDGKEAKASPTIVSSNSSTSLPTQDLYQLNHYIQEALAREQLLENKLAVLQRLVGQTESASSDAWKSLIDEDRLLTRVEILESQLTTYGKGVSEDKLREEAIRLMEEKERYQETAKETLKKLVDEKLESVKRMDDLERSLSNTEDEYSTLKELYDREVDENRKLAEEISRLNAELEVRQAKDDAAEGEETENTAGQQMSDLTSEDQGSSLRDHHQGTSVDGPEVNNEESVADDEDNSLMDRVKQLSQELSESRRLFEESNRMSQSYREDLDYTQGKLKMALEMLEKKDEEIDELESRNFHQNNYDTIKPELHRSDNEIVEMLKGQISELNQVVTENEHLKAELDKTSSLRDDVIRLEQALSSAEERITDLLKIKEKYAEVSQEKLNQTLSLNELEEQVETLSFQSRLATFFAIVPILILCLAICVAYLPIFSTVFGTAEKL